MGDAHSAGMRKDGGVTVRAFVAQHTRDIQQPGRDTARCCAIRFTPLRREVDVASGKWLDECPLLPRQHAKVNLSQPAIPDDGGPDARRLAIDRRSLVRPNEITRKYQRYRCSEPKSEIFGLLASRCRQPRVVDAGDPIRAVVKCSAVTDEVQGRARIRELRRRSLNPAPVMDGCGLGKRFELRERFGLGVHSLTRLTVLHGRRNRRAKRFQLGAREGSTANPVSRSDTGCCWSRQFGLLHVVGRQITYPPR